jgi:hypothetical protein
MPVFVVGVDPHKGSHTATVLEGTEEVIAECRFDADGRQLGRRLEWGEPFRPRRWAVEGATGAGALLARRLFLQAGAARNACQLGVPTQVRDG